MRGLKNVAVVVHLHTFDRYSVPTERTLHLWARNGLLIQGLAS